MNLVEDWRLERAQLGSGNIIYSIRGLDELVKPVSSRPVEIGDPLICIMQPWVVTGPLQGKRSFR